QNVHCVPLKMHDEELKIANCHHTILDLTISVLLWVLPCGSSFEQRLLSNVSKALYSLRNYLRQWTLYRLSFRHEHLQHVSAGNNLTSRNEMKSLCESP